MNKGIMWISSMALAMFISQPVLAMDHQCPCYKEMKEKMMQKLNLTAEQKTKLEDIKNKYKDQMKSNRDEMKNLRKQMKDLVKADKMDEAKLEELISEKKELVGTNTKAKLQMKHDMYNVLTPEQVNKIDEAKKEMKGKCMMQDGKKMDHKAGDSTQMMDLDDDSDSSDE